MVLVRLLLTCTAMTAASASHPFDIVVDPTDGSFQGMDISASLSLHTILINAEVDSSAPPET